MITARGSVPYPPTADARPILELVADLRQMAAGLGNGAGQLTTTASTAQASWVGQAAQAFLDRMAQRSATIDEVARTIASAATPLQTFAAAITSTSAAYSSAAIAEQAARAGLPWTAGALAAALAAESAALGSLQAAGVACAGALAVIEAKVAATQYTLSTMDDDRPASTTPAPTTPQPQPQPAPTPTPTTAVRDEPDWDRLLEQVVAAAHVASVTMEGAVDGLEKGVERALHDFRATYRRNGELLERWRARMGGPTTGMTYAEAKAAAHRLAGWGRRIGPIGLVVDGVDQAVQDSRNTSLTTGQRIGRLSAAVAVQGGATMAGASLGATQGAAAGAAIGVWFGGVGAVPGAMIGGFVGGVGGAWGGSIGGKALKEALFQWNPGGGFR